MIVQPLASYAPSQPTIFNNLSRSVSLSVLDRQGNELNIRTEPAYPIEFIIPRDPNTVVPPMSLQNVTSINDNTHRLIFNLHHVALPSSDPSSSASVHLEIQSLNITLAYLFIYRFDLLPQLNSSLRQIDGWSLLCPSSNVVPCHRGNISIMSRALI